MDLASLWDALTHIIGAHTALLAYRANDPDVMTELCGHLEARRVHPVVEPCYPLAQALRQVDGGLKLGKIVITR